MKRLQELFGIWLLTPVTHSESSRKGEFQHLFIFVPLLYQRWHVSWLHWHWHTCLMEGSHYDLTVALAVIRRMYYSVFCFSCLNMSKKIISHRAVSLFFDVKIFFLTYYLHY